jgi:hypothetical protein
MTKRQVIATIVTLAYALVLDGWAFAGVSWNVMVSTSTPPSYFTAGTYSSAVGFVKLQTPNGATLVAGSVVTITNSQAGTPVPPAVLSNGTLVITVGIASNSLQAIAGMNSTNMPMKLNLVGE